MLVPDLTSVPPPGQLDHTSTPGAARSTSGPKLLKLANESSGPRTVDWPSPPGKPSVSTTAETVITSSYEAGTFDAALDALFPAATTYTTPAATELQIASCNASPLVRPQFPSSGKPVPPRLMFATSISSACPVTQSTPAMMSEESPKPKSFNTLTDQIRAPGATPTTPESSS